MNQLVHSLLRNWLLLDFESHKNTQGVRNCQTKVKSPSKPENIDLNIYIYQNPQIFKIFNIMRVSEDLWVCQEHSHKQWDKS